MGRRADTGAVVKRNLGRRARSLVTILTELPRLIVPYQQVNHYNF
jgi:hypothetical protein